MRFLIGIALLTCLISSCFATTVIDTTDNSSWATVGRWGEIGSETMGQTFTVGSDNRLDYINFYLCSTINEEYTEHLQFAMYVMQWNADKATGPILFESAPISTTGNAFHGNFEKISVDIGGIDLDVGEQYVAFVSVSEYISGQNSSGWMAYGGEAYSDGTFVYIDNGSNTSAWTNSSWVTTYPGGDLIFEVGFNVPEPTTLLLLGLGAMVFRRRRCQFKYRNGHAVN